ncbi:unnamed protein product, partial [Thlaspi arvense]
SAHDSKNLNNALTRHNSRLIVPEVINPNYDQVNFEESVYVGALESQQREYANNWKDIIALSMWNDAMEAGSQHQW